MVGALQFAVVQVLQTGTRVRAEILSWRTRVFVLTRALTGVTVPGVTTCTVETLQLLPGQVGQTLTRARV